MIQFNVNPPAQASYGFENLTRFAVQSSRPSDGGARSESAGGSSDKTKELTPEQQRQVDQLKNADREVRLHEQAHLAVGRDLVLGGPSYTYQTGPDNRRYAVSGEVSIDASPARTPEETIPKAQHIRETALAPAEPSAQDRSVAAKASSMEREAQATLAAQERAQSSGGDRGGAARYLQAVPAQAAGLRLDVFA